MTGSGKPDTADGGWRFRLNFACLFFALVYTALLIFTQFSLLQDGDTYWHIATGRWIVENMAVPHSDVFSHTFLGQLWLAKEWLSQLLLYGAYEIGGWQGVNSFGLLLVATTVALTCAICLGYLRFSIAVGVTFIVAIFASVHYLARPHLVAYPIMMLWTMGVVFAADRQRVPSFWLVPVMTLWANLHGGFTLGLVIAGLMSLETLMAVPRSELKPHLLRHGIFLGLATLAALLTPFGIQSILITPKIMGLGEVLDYVAEWRSPDFHRHEYHLFVLIALLGFALYGGMRLKLMRLVAVLVLTFLMFKHVRAMPVFGFLMPILLVRPLSEQFAGLSMKAQLSSKDTDPILSFFHRHSGKLPIVAAVILAIGAVVAVTDRDYGSASEKTKPVGAVAFAQAHGLTGNVFNEYAFGGYLIFSRIPTYIDGRAELYGRDFFNEHNNAVWQLPGGDLFKLLDEHDITWTLLRPDSTGSVALDQSKNWRCVYQSETSTLHIRISAPEAAQALKASEAKPCKRAIAE